MELLFALGFTLHNIEEGLWLPAWSKHAGKFHKEISSGEFRFSVIMVTALGYLFTAQFLIFSETSFVSRFLYLGFVLMMTGNVLFPHLLATIVLKRYAPGLLTGLMLNLPLGLYLILRSVNTKKEVLFLVIAGVLVSALTLSLIRLFFRIGRKVTNQK